MKIVITAGAMREPIDDVRVITNISSGALGAIIADKLYESGHDITFISSKGSLQPIYLPMHRITASSFKEVNEALNYHIPFCDVIIHSMAVSDFSFKQDENQKIHTKEDFVNFISNNIVVNPKMLKGFRDLKPNALIFGFKFEVGLSHEDLIKKAANQNERCKLDWTVANDKIEMNNAKSHIAYLVSNKGEEIKCNSKYEIAIQISDIIGKAL